jgi:hypothetical protein
MPFGFGSTSEWHLESPAEDLKNLEKDFVLILCVSASKAPPLPQRQLGTHCQLSSQVEMGSTSYVQGAGDDEEASLLGSRL